MKKITFTILFFLLYSTIFAQGFEFKRSNQMPINNGDIISFGTLGESSNLNFRVKNVSNVPLDVKIKCISMVNSTGSQFQLCYGGACFDSVTINGTYPDYEYFLQPGQSNPSQGEHFQNNDTGNNNIVDYVFKVYAVGAESQSITFTYRYNPALSVGNFKDLSALGINLQNTVINNELNFNSSNSGKITLVNMNGQQIAEYSFIEGATQNINLSHLSAGIYVANFQTTEGKNSQVKLIKN